MFDGFHHPKIISDTRPEVGSLSNIRWSVFDNAHTHIRMSESSRIGKVTIADPGTRTREGRGRQRLQNPPKFGKHARDAKHGTMRMAGKKRGCKFANLPPSVFFLCTIQDV